MCRAATVMQNYEVKLKTAKVRKGFNARKSRYKPRNR